MEKQVNIAVQVLPVSNTKGAYSIVDCAIDEIKRSGVKYRVTPFETVMEGSYDELMSVVKKVQLACYKDGAESVMCFVKIQSSAKKEVTIMDKMKKYE